MMFSRTAAAALLMAAGVAAIPCGNNNAFSMYGSSAVVPVAKAWAAAYGKACGNSITVTSAGASSGGGSIQGAQAVCGVGGTTVDIGLLNRQLISPSEASQNSKNPFLYTCVKGNTNRQLTEVQVALDGIALLSAPNGIAAKCIASLAGGGLTFSQVRYIFSSFTLAKLRSDPLFDPLAVLGSTAGGSSRKWSDLCFGASCNCPNTDIGIAGSPTTSGTFTFFAEKFLTGPGETVRSGFLSDPTDSNTFVVNTVTASGNSATIGFTSFAPYNTNANKVYASSVQDPDDGVYRFPTFAQFSTGEYPASFFLYMEVAGSALSTVQDFFVYAYSDSGNTDVLNTGLLPIAGINAVQMLSRLGAPGGINTVSANIPCGPGGNIFMGGSSTVYPVAYLWGNVYADACGLTVKVLSGGSTLGAHLACGIPDPVSGKLADIGNMSRQFLTTEIVLQSNGYDYKCLIGTKRVVREFPVALDGITFSYPLGGVAAACISSLPGKGLSPDQLRWIYSSFTIAQLIAHGWDKSSVPNSDGNDATHLWSELSSSCAAKEIAIAGSPSVAGTYEFFTGATFSKGTGETIALNRPLGYYNVPEDNPNEVVIYLQNTPTSIGFFGYSYFDKNRATLGAFPIKNKSGTYLLPSYPVFADGSYNPYTRFVYMQLVTVFLTFQKTSAFLKFGTGTTVGDTLATSAGLFPLGSGTKTLIKPRFTLSVPCFSETATVQVMDKGVVAMKDLKIGDQVVNAEGKFDTVYSFGHFSHEIEAEFVQIHAAGVKPLEISKEHMLFTAVGAAVPASAIVVGDKIQLSTGASAHVEKIATVVRHGAYAPFTMSGTIAVNQVAASSYIDLQNNAGVLMISGYKTPFTMQFLAHMFQAPHRLACMVSPAYCQSESYDETGVSAWVARPLAFTEWAIKQNSIVMSAIFAACFMVGVAVYAVELMLASKVLMLVTVASFLAVRSAKKGRKQV